MVTAAPERGSPSASRTVPLNAPAVMDWAGVNGGKTREARTLRAASAAARGSPCPGPPPKVQNVNPLLCAEWMPHPRRCWQTPVLAPVPQFGAKILQGVSGPEGQLGRG